MAITTKQQRQQRRNEALQLIADGVPPTDAATQLTVKWGCSRRTSLRDMKLAQSELANALNSVEIQQMVGWLATQYQRLAAKAERDGQYAAACGCLNSLRVMLVQPQLDRQLEAQRSQLRNTQATKNCSGAASEGTARRRGASGAALSLRPSEAAQEHQKP